MLKKFPLGKINVTKNALFFLRKFQLITVLIGNSPSSLGTRLISLKLCVGVFIFDSVSFLLKFTFLFNKKHRFFDFKSS